MRWLAAAIIVLGIILRVHNFDQFPMMGETLDESAWSILGASLWQTGRPAAWSAFLAYQDHKTDYTLRGYPIVSPALDHPPLFALLPGFFHSLKAEWFELASVRLVRFPMLVLGGVNLVLFWLVAQRWFRNNWALVALGLYATIPAIVLSSRLVLAENLLQTWVMALLLVLSSWQKLQKARWGGWLIVLVCAAAIMTKLAGVALPIALIGWALWRKNHQLLKAAVVGLTLGVAAWLLYGMAFDPQLFWQVQLQQAGRDIGLTTLLNRWFLNPTLVGKIFFDGWFWLGLITAVSLAIGSWTEWSKDKSWQTWTLAMLIAHTIFIAMNVGERTYHGWYDYVLWPLVVLWCAQLFQHFWQQKQSWGWWFVWLLLLPIWRMGLVISTEGFVFTTWLTRGLVAVGLVPGGVALLNRPKWLRLSVILIAVLLLMAQIYVTWNISDRPYTETAGFYGFL